MLSKRHCRLVMGLLLAVMLLILAACSETKQDTSENDATAVSETTVAVEKVVWNKICPVCGDKVNLEGKTVTYDGKVYGFGCAGCPEKFEKSPENYVENLNEDGSEFIGG